MTKQVTHSEQSVWDEMIEKELKNFRVLPDELAEPRMHGFKLGASFTENNLKHVPKVSELIAAAQDAQEALKKLRYIASNSESIAWFPIVRLNNALKDFE